MTATTFRVPRATVTVDASTVPIADGSEVTLDEAWAPYAQATVETTLGEVAATRSTDPRDNIRATINAAVAGHFAPADPVYSSWTEIARNLIPNPRGVAGAAVWAVSTGVITYGTAFAGPIAATCARTVTTVTTAVLFGPQVALAVSTKYTVKMRVLSSGTLTGLSVRYRPNGTGSTTGEVTGATDVSTITPGAQTVVTATFTTAATVPAASAMLGLRWSTGSAVGITVDISEIIVVTGAVAPSFFDGAVPDLPLEQYSWVGAVNASASTHETRTILSQPPPVWTPDGTRPFNLGVRSRLIDYRSRSVTLTLASDEALLQDYAPLADDPVPRTHEKSLRAVVNYVLSVVFPTTPPTLEPGPDADVTAYWALTNPILNPSGSGSTAQWASTGGSTLFYVDWAGFSGTTAVGMDSAGAGVAGLAPFVSDTQGIVASPGRSYVFTGYGYNPLSVARTLFARIRFFDINGVPLGQPVSSVGVALPTAAWKRASVIAVAPAGAVKARGWFDVGGATAAAQATYHDAAMIYEGDEVVPYFDGSTIAGGGYTYHWNDVANASGSSRVPVTERPPESLIWKAGVSAWDFLTVLIAQAGLRLFCDELRVWRMVAADYAIARSVTITPDVSAELADTISREDPQLWATGVVMRYVWEDDAGTHTRVDSAGTPEKVLRYDIARPFPGPGVAAYRLVQLQARGRVQTAQTPSQQAATPAVEMRVSIANVAPQVGRLRAVTFDLYSGMMQLQSKGLTGYTDDSWGAANPATLWQTVPDATTWENYTPN